MMWLCHIIIIIRYYYEITHIYIPENSLMGKLLRNYATIKKWLSQNEAVYISYMTTTI